MNNDLISAISKSVIAADNSLPTLITKRIAHRGSKWCITSEDGSKELGCGNDKKWAVTRLAQIEYFKRKDKSLTEDTIAEWLMEDNIDTEGNAEFDEFVAKNLPAMIHIKEGEVGDEDDVEEAVEDIEGNYDNPKIAKKNGQTMSEEEALKKKHMAGKHDQKEHAGQAQAAMSQRPTNVFAARKMRDKVVTELKGLRMAKGIGGDIKKRLSQKIADLENNKNVKDLPTMTPHIKEAFALASEAKTGRKPVTQQPAAEGKVPTGKGDNPFGVDASKGQAGAVNVRKPSVPTAENVKPATDQTHPTVGKDKAPQVAAKAQSWSQKMTSFVKGHLNTLAKVASDQSIMAKVKANVKARGAYNEWHKSQSQARDLTTKMNALKGKRNASGIPPLEFYQTAKALSVVQNKAAVASARFHQVMGMPVTASLVDKHLPGKHDQQSHAGSKANKREGKFELTDGTKSEARSLLRDARMMITKVVESPSLGKYASNSYMLTVKKIDGMIRDLRDGAYDEKFGTDLVAKKMFESDLNDALVPFYGSMRFPKDARRTKSTGEEKHLANKHDQKDHGHRGGGVAHTVSQLRDAAAVQVAKDEGISVAAAKKKVAAVDLPTKKINLGSSKFLYSLDADLQNGDTLNAYIKHSHGDNVSAVVRFNDDADSRNKTEHFKSYDKAKKWLNDFALDAGMTMDGPATYEDRIQVKKLLNKSLVEKAAPDTKCLQALWKEYYKYYSGKWIAQAWTAYRAKNWEKAATAFESARDGFQRDKNPNEFNCLNGWAKSAREQGGVAKHLAGKHDQKSHAGSIRAHAATNILADDIGNTSNESRRALGRKAEAHLQSAKEYLVQDDLDRGVRHLEESIRYADKGGFDRAGDKLRSYLKELKGTTNSLEPEIVKPFALVGAKSSVGFIQNADAPPTEVEWRITKARTRDDGVMEWYATTTKFDRDVQRDKVTKAFYEEAIKRFKSGTVDPPFFSVAHYGKCPECDKCGAKYRSLTDYKCSECGEDRLIAGITTDIWIDGKQPKAKGYFYPTEVGKTMYLQIKSDIEKNLPHDEKIRISMGFYPDPGDGTIVKSEGRDFMKGWIEHFAGTRVPVVGETEVGVN